MTVQAVAHGVEPVMMVIHEDHKQAGWSYLPGRDYETGELLLIHASHLLEADPSLRETQSMAPATYAERQSVDEPWTFKSLDALPTGESLFQRFVGGVWLRLLELRR